MLSPNEFRTFWVSWLDGYLQVGRGNQAGRNMFASWQDPNPVKRQIHAISVTTGNWQRTGSTGVWEFSEFNGNKSSQDLFLLQPIFYSTVIFKVFMLIVAILAAVLIIKTTHIYIPLCKVSFLNRFPNIFNKILAVISFTTLELLIISDI